MNETSQLTPEARLAELGLSIPPIAPAVGNYVGAVQVDNLLFVSGHGPVKDGEYIFRGKLGRDMEVEEGKQAAQLCILNLLGSVKEQIGELDRVKRIVKLLCLVNSAPDFGAQPSVADGASDLLVEIFGPERGPHGRSAIGMGALPFGIAVEIEGIFEIA